MATLNPNLKDFWIDDDGCLIQARNRVLYGGRSSSKSWEFAGRASQIAQEYKTRILCVRRFQNKIKDSVYTLIKNQIDNFDFKGYNILASSIEHSNGSEMVFYGIERNIDEIKSFEGADILWIEEAHNLTKEQWEILEPTIRKDYSEIWISFNPRMMTDFIYQKFVVNQESDTIVRKINYDQNPFLSDTMRKVIQKVKETDYDAYRHIYLGEPNSNDESSIIKRKWVDAAIDFHKKYTDIDLTGGNVVGYDVADSGNDDNASVGFNGNICDFVDKWRGGEDELGKSAKRVYNYAKKIGAFVIYDSIGVGAHVGSTLKDLGYKKHKGFNAGGKVYKPNLKYMDVKQGEYFSNIKAQAWWLVADLFRNTYDYVVNGNKNYKPSELISISSDVKYLDALITELCTPFMDFDKAGKIKVESKDDMKSRGIESPNIADAFIMGKCRSIIGATKASKVDLRGF